MAVVAIYKGVVPMLTENPVYAATKLLIDARKRINYCHGEFNKIDNYSPMSVLKEWNTIKVGGGRRIGHSTAIVELCTNVFKKAIILVPNLVVVDRYKKMFISPQISTFDCNKKYNGDVCVIVIKKDFENFYNKFRGIDFVPEAIFVDCTSLCNEAQVEKIYALARNFYTFNKNLLVIFME